MDYIKKRRPTVTCTSEGTPPMSTSTAGRANRKTHPWVRLVMEIESLSKRKRGPPSAVGS